MASEEDRRGQGESLSLAAPPESPAAQTASEPSKSWSLAHRQPSRRNGLSKLCQSRMALSGKQPFLSPAASALRVKVGATLGSTQGLCSCREKAFVSGDAGRTLSCHVCSAVILVQETPFQAAVGIGLWSRVGVSRSGGCETAGLGRVGCASQTQFYSLGLAHAGRPRPGSCFPPGCRQVRRACGRQCPGLAEKWEVPLPPLPYFSASAGACGAQTQPGGRRCSASVAYRRRAYLGIGRCLLGVGGPDRGEAC